jgi:hypothetical protein
MGSAGEGWRLKEPLWGGRQDVGGEELGHTVMGEVEAALGAAVGGQSSAAPQRLRQ